MQRSTLVPLMVSGPSVVCFLVATPFLHAAIVASGDVVPSPPYDQAPLGSVRVGASADGTLRVDAGSILFAEDIIGIGGKGNGRLIVADGGRVGVWGPTGSGSMSIRGESGGTGAVTVEGDGSRVSPRGLSVGPHGSLTISGGGAVRGEHAHIGGQPGAPALVLVDGTGSRADFSGELGGFRVDDAVVYITNGAALHSGHSGRIGSAGGSTVTVEGAGSTWTHAGRLHVGYSGSGTLSVSGGLLEAGGLNVGGTGGTGNLGLSAGAAAIVAGTTCVDPEAASVGVLEFGPGGGTLRTHTLMASPNDLAGTGTIFARGLVGDIELTLDSQASLRQSLMLASSPEYDIRLNLDLRGNNGHLGAGYKGYGSTVISGGVDIATVHGYIGYHRGSQGVVSVRGVGSTWRTQTLYVGRSGNGTLNINAGGAVRSGYARIGDSAGSTGAVAVVGAGSQWNAGSLCVGKFGIGTLTVSGGGTVSSSSLGSSVGVEAGSVGAVSVNGLDSFWRTGTLVVAEKGRGTLNIAGGASVSSRDSSVGKYAGGVGVVTVDGPGSNWTTEALSLGGDGNASLSITGGGTVVATSVVVATKSRVTLDVGTGSALSVDGGWGLLTNNGRVRVVAGAAPPAHSDYTPILAGTWIGGGTIQPIGGAWDTVNHMFTASEIQLGVSGAPVEVDLAETQRVLVSDAITGWAVGVSFPASRSRRPVAFSATPVEESSLNQLEALLEPDHSVLGAWELAASGFTASDNEPVYLSFGTGEGYARGDFTFWHNDGEGWSLYEPEMFTYDGHYASLVVTSFSAYAISAVPEPGTLVLLFAAAFAGLLWRARRAG